jgi:hypothetical protein
MHVLGLSESEIKEAVDLSHDIRDCLEKIRVAREEGSSLAHVAKRFKSGVGLSVEELIDKLTQLPGAIDASDADTIAEIDDVIDAFVDFIDLETKKASSLGTTTGSDGELVRRLKAWRRSAGKLAQYLCQMTETPEK